MREVRAGKTNISGRWAEGGNIGGGSKTEKHGVNIDMTWVSQPGSRQQPAASMASEAELGQQEKPVYKKIIEYKKKIALGKESISIFWLTWKPFFIIKL